MREFSVSGLACSPRDPGFFLQQIFAQIPCFHLLNSCCHSFPSTNVNAKMAGIFIYSKPLV